VISLVSLVWALWLSIQTESTIVIASGLVVIYAGGAAFLVICGILSELVYKTGDVRPEDFFRVRKEKFGTIRPECDAEKIDE
jgi:hypothetical protein